MKAMSKATFCIPSDFETLTTAVYARCHRFNPA